jgi:hypothetical protein
MRRYGLATFALSVLALTFGAASSGARNISGTWSGIGGAAGTYVIMQTGATVKWYGHSDDGHTWAHDFTGTMKGNALISGTFQDRAGYDVHQRGTVQVRVEDGCHLSFVSASVPWGTTSWTKKNCAAADLLVPIETVSNGCGGAGWDSLVKLQNYLGNTSKFSISNINPVAGVYTVNFKAACDLHDAGYTGAVVRDRLHGNRIVDFRKLTRAQIDLKFLADMQLLCKRYIPASAPTARKNCMSTGGNASVGAMSRFDFVRCWGNLFFNANPPNAGPRRNDKVATLSRYCFFFK